MKLHAAGGFGDIFTPGRRNSVLDGKPRSRVLLPTGNGAHPGGTVRTRERRALFAVPSSSHLLYGWLWMVCGDVLGTPALSGTAISPAARPIAPSPSAPRGPGDRP